MQSREAWSEQTQPPKRLSLDVTSSRKSSWTQLNKGRSALSWAVLILGTGLCCALLPLTPHLSSHPMVHPEGRDGIDLVFADTASVQNACYPAGVPYIVWRHKYHLGN